MRDAVQHRMLCVLISAFCLAGGIVLGFAVAFGFWALIASEGEEAGAPGLIWLLCLVAVPLGVLLVRRIVWSAFRRIGFVP